MTVPSTSAAAGAPSLSRVALLVDDSRLDQLATRRLLLGAHSGFERLEWLDAWPGVEAALARGPFDLFLVDMHLGAASGLDVIRELRAAGVRAPIIALTGQGSDEIDRACTDAGASDFLIKGVFDAAALERSIRYADRQATMLRELDRLNAVLERRVIVENEQAQLMRFAIEQSSDALLISRSAHRTDPEAAPAQVVVFVNAALCRLLGRRAGELLAADVASLLVPVDGPAPDTPFDPAVPTAAAHAYRFVETPESGDPLVTVAPLRPPDGTVTHYVWTARTAALSFRGRDAASGQRRTDRLTVLIGNLELLETKLSAEPTAPLVRAAIRAANDLMVDRRTS